MTDEHVNRYSLSIALEQTREERPSAPRSCPDTQELYGCEPSTTNLPKPYTRTPLTEGNIMGLSSSTSNRGPGALTSGHHLRPVQ
jgi:hypothetical protein